MSGPTIDDNGTQQQGLFGDNNHNKNNTAAFAQHTAADTALNPSSNDDDAGIHGEGMSTVGKIAVFLFFPLTMGVLGLYMSHLEKRRKPDKTLNLDQDFIYPFLLALAFSIVVGFQTSGFKSKKIKPLIQWPKVKRVKKVVHKKKKKNINNNDNVTTRAKKEE